MQAAGTRRVLGTAPFLAIAALGALVVHQLAYVATAGLEWLPHGFGPLVSDLDHAHLSTQWALLTPVAVVGAVVLVLRQVRDLGYRSSSTTGIAAASSVLFLVQEGLEGWFAGSATGGLITTPVAVGLLLAPIVGRVIVRLLADAAEVVARYPALPTMVFEAAQAALRPSNAVPQPLTIRSVDPARGPPVRIR
jgi:hypothetical protein